MRCARAPPAFRPCGVPKCAESLSPAWVQGVTSRLTCHLWSKHPQAACLTFVCLCFCRGESRNAFLLEILWEWDDVGWERGVCSHDKGWGVVIRIVKITSFPLLVNLCFKKKKNRYSILPSCSTFVSCLNNIPDGAFSPSLGPEGKRIQVALQNRYHHQPWHSRCLGRLNRVIHTSYICMEMKLLDKIVFFFFWYFLLLTVINPGSQTHKPYWVFATMRKNSAWVRISELKQETLDFWGLEIMNQHGKSFHHQDVERKLYGLKGMM